MINNNIKEDGASNRLSSEDIRSEIRKNYSDRPREQGVAIEITRRLAQARIREDYSKVASLPEITLKDRQDAANGDLEAMLKFLDHEISGASLMGAKPIWLENLKLSLIKTEKEAISWFPWMAKFF